MWGRISSGLLGGLIVAAIGTSAASAATPTVQTFPVTTLNAGVTDITTGPFGKLWFTEGTANKIGVMNTAGVVEAEYSVGITPNAGVREIVAGPDRNVWFTETAANKVAKISTSGGAVVEYPLPAGTEPRGITVGPDNNLWFAESEPPRGVGRITTAGVVTEFPVTATNPGQGPTGIAAGPDGNIWFTDFADHQVGRMTTSGTVLNEYPVSMTATTTGLALGPDGNLWFGDYNDAKVGRVTTAGSPLEFPTLTNPSQPLGIVTGQDGNLWFAEQVGGHIGRVTPGGSVSEFPVSGTASLDGIATGPDGNIWFTEYSSNSIGRINTALNPPAFRNPGAIAIPAGQPGSTSGPADPYPSTIEVSGLQGTVTKVTARLTGLGHQFPDDIDAMLVGPQGQNAWLTSDNGGAVDQYGVTLNFSDAAPYPLGGGGPMVSGIFQPTDSNTGSDNSDTFPAPAPAPQGSSLAVFNGTDPNGTWRLFINDDANGDVGNLRGGWGLDIETAAGPPPAGPQAPAPGCKPGFTLKKVKTKKGKRKRKCVRKKTHKKK